jgi:hypothetical protein
MRNKRDVVERNLTTRDGGDKKDVEKWRDAWFEVDGLDQDERNGMAQHHNMLQRILRKERERGKGGSRSAQG